MPPADDDRAPDSRERGSVSLELVGTLPFLLLAIAVAAQIAISGASLWSAALAARAGARASLIRGGAAEAARRALPPALRRGAVVGDSGGVSVEVPVPRLIPDLPGLRVGTRTRLGEGG